MVKTRVSPLRLELRNSDSPQNPAEFMGWTLHSFGNGDKITDTDREEFVKGFDGKEVKPAARFRKKIDAGTAFWLSYYEHGEGHFSLKGEGQQRPWDGTTLAGILVWSNKVRDLPAGYEARQKVARAFLEIYNQWANGHIYSWVLEDEDGEEIDAGDEQYDEKMMFAEIVKAVGDRPVIIEGEAAWLADFHGDGLTVVDEDWEDEDED